MKFFLFLSTLFVLTACIGPGELMQANIENPVGGMEMRDTIMSMIERNRALNNSRSISSDGNKTIEPSKVEEFTCIKESRKAKIKPVDINISFIEADIREALIELSVLSNTAIVVDDTVEGLVTANLEGVSLKKSLEVILAAGSYSFVAITDYILIGGSTPDSPSFSKLAVTCHYKPYHLRPLDLAASLTPYFQQFVRVPKMVDYLTITAPREIQTRIQKNIKLFDSPPAQVLLEVSIVEVSREVSSILGVSWGDLLKNLSQPIQQVSGQLLSATPTHYSVLADAINVLESEGIATLKAMPSIVSLEGREAKFSTQHTILPPQDSTYSRGAKHKEINYGVDVNIIPRVANNGTITLNIIKASVSDMSELKSGLAHIVAHEISNTVSVGNGETLILGGLLQSRNVKKSKGIPVARKINVIGSLFGSKETQLQQTEVLIMIRPRIL